MLRYSAWAWNLIVERAPGYAGALEMGRTSFRPQSVDDEPASPRRDDRRLHVDAFASHPTGGRRILQSTSPTSIRTARSRAWRVGEPFEAYARRCDGAAKALHRHANRVLGPQGGVGVTKAPAHGLRQPDAGAP